MKHDDHVNLLRPAELKPGGTWADLGAGSGAFTLALRELIGAGGVIFAVDKDRSRLNELEREYHSHFGNTGGLQIIPGDFTRPLNLHALDGVLMANSLHYFRDKEKILLNVQNLMKPGGTLLVIEYNVDRGNPWVPYPMSFETWHNLAQRVGFNEPRLLARRSSSFLREFYSAGCIKKTEV
jgi:ubiquinone/menaquinone biosynthesis C-methylase UbiE